MEITKQTTMGQMLDFDPGIAYILMQSGMHCVGCPSSIGESLEEACMVHGLDVDTVFAEIQNHYDAFCTTGAFAREAILRTHGAAEKPFFLTNEIF